MLGQSQLVGALEPEDFVRGATGQVRLVLENPSDVETEVLMARSSGKQASDELRLILKDQDGNTLSEQAVKQATGDVITLSDTRIIYGEEQDTHKQKPIIDDENGQTMPMPKR